MNRAERRRAGRSVASATYVLNRAQVEQIKREATDEATRRMFAAVLALPCLALRDEFGFGRERLQRYLLRAVGWFESLERGEVDLVETCAQLEAETGLTIRDNGRGGLEVHVPERGE